MLAIYKLSVVILGLLLFLMGYAVGQISIVAGQWEAVLIPAAAIFIIYLLSREQRKILEQMEKGEDHD